MENKKKYYYAFLRLITSYLQKQQLAMLFEEIFLINTFIFTKMFNNADLYLVSSIK